MFMGANRSSSVKSELYLLPFALQLQVFPTTFQPFTLLIISTGINNSCFLVIRMYFTVYRSLLCLVLTVLNNYVAAQNCNTCPGCTQSFSVFSVLGVGSKDFTQTCPAGQVVVVLNGLNFQSTDNSKFSVTTKSLDNGVKILVLSSPAPASCFTYNGPTKFVTDSNSVSVKVTCEKLAGSCNLLTSLSYDCAPAGSVYLGDKFLPGPAPTTALLPSTTSQTITTPNTGLIVSVSGQSGCQCLCNLRILGTLGTDCNACQDNCNAQFAGQCASSSTISFSCSSSSVTINDIDKLANNQDRNAASESQSQSGNAAPFSIISLLGICIGSVFGGMILGSIGMYSYRRLTSSKQSKAIPTGEIKVNNVNSTAAVSVIATSAPAPRSDGKIFSSPIMVKTNQVLMMSIALISIALIAAPVPVSAQTCFIGCVDCTYAKIDWGIGQPPITVSIVEPGCLNGQTAVLNSLHVDSGQTGNKFQVATATTASGTTIYPAASTTKSTTCFEMPLATQIVGTNPNLYVIISCHNWGFSCDLHYRVSFTCIGGSNNALPPSSPSNACDVINCGQFGNCDRVQGRCVCNSGYTGNLCDISPAAANPPALVPDMCNCVCCNFRNCAANTLAGTVPNLCSAAAGDLGCSPQSCTAAFPTQCPAVNSQILAGCASTYVNRNNQIAAGGNSGNSGGGSAVIGLTSGEIAGIVVGVIVGILAVGFCAYYLHRFFVAQAQSQQNVVKMQHYQARMQGQQMAQQRVAL
jgi:hypothetical protein